jgi:hypothetical protein
MHAPTSSVFAWRFTRRSTASDRFRPSRSPPCWRRSSAAAFASPTRRRERRRFSASCCCAASRKIRRRAIPRCARCWRFSATIRSAGDGPWQWSGRWHWWRSSPPLVCSGSPRAASECAAGRRRSWPASGSSAIMVSAATRFIGPSWAPDASSPGRPGSACPGCSTTTAGAGRRCTRIPAKRRMSAAINPPRCWT